MFNMNQIQIADNGGLINNNDITKGVFIKGAGGSQTSINIKPTTSTIIESSLLVSGSTASHITASGAISASGDLTINQIKPTKIELEKSSTTDGNANGEVVYFGSETAGVAAGRIVYYNAAGNWSLTDADAESTADGLLGVALGSDLSADGVLLKGMVTLDHDPGTIGDPLFLGTGPGSASSAAPNGTNDIVRLIGYCVDSTNGQIYFNPSNDFIKHT